MLILFLLFVLYGKDCSFSAYVNLAYD